MKAILIDSDILIEVSRARDAAVLANWDDLSRSDALLLCSPVTVAEIWHGARVPEHPALNALFAALTCVPIDAEIGRRSDCGDSFNSWVNSSGRATGSTTQ